MLQIVPTYVPALSFLPARRRPVNWLDEREVESFPVLSSVSYILDALAILCVCEPDEAFATAVDITPSGVTLFIASNHPDGVPTTAVKHIQGVLDLVTTFAKGNSGDGENLARKLVDKQYSYCWPLLKQRLACDAPEVVKVLQGVVDSKKLPDAEFASAPSVGIPDSNRFMGYIKKLLAALRDVVAAAAPIVQPNEDVSYLVETKLEALRAAFSPKFTEPERSLFRDILYDIESSASTPVCDILLKIMSVEDGISPLLCLAVSKDAGWLFSKVDIIRFSPQTGSFAIDVEPSKFLDILMKDASKDPTSQSQVAHRVHNHVVDSLRGVAQQMSNSSAAAIDGRQQFAARVHPECALFAHLHGGTTTNALPYIGTSELSCLSCFRVIFDRVHAECKHTKPLIRGTTGRTTTDWTTPMETPDCILNHSVQNLEKCFQQDGLEAARRFPAK